MKLVLTSVEQAMQMLSDMENTDISSAVGSVGYILKIIMPIFQYAGIVLLVVGIGKFLLSLKDESSSAKVEAIIFIVISIFMCGIETTLGGLFNALGIVGVF